MGEESLKINQKYLFHHHQIFTVLFYKSLLLQFFTFFTISKVHFMQMTNKYRK